VDGEGVGFFLAVEDVVLLMVSLSVTESGNEEDSEVLVVVGAAGAEEAEEALIPVVVALGVVPVQAVVPVSDAVLHLRPAALRLGPIVSLVSKYVQCGSKALCLSHNGWPRTITTTTKFVSQHTTFFADTTTPTQHHSPHTHTHPSSLARHQNRLFRSVCPSICLVNKSTISVHS
jgi:hypothetical protein